MVYEQESTPKKSTFIISIKPSSELEMLTRPNAVRKTREELRLMSVEKQRMIEPAKRYLDSLGLALGRDYDLKINLCAVIATLTPEQAEHLKRQSYVRDVIEDLNLKLIR